MLSLLQLFNVSFDFIWNVSCSRSIHVILLLMFVAGKSATTFDDLPDWWHTNISTFNSLFGDISYPIEHYPTNQ